MLECVTCCSAVGCVADGFQVSEAEPTECERQWRCEGRLLCGALVVHDLSQGVASKSVKTEKWPRCNKWWDAAGKMCELGHV